MSFIRKPDGRSRPIKPQRRRPGWDDTVNDLTVYKATPDEIAHRKVSHMSHNRELVKEEQFKKVIRKAKLKEKDNSNADRRKANILKEVIMDQSQLQEVLSKSDRAISIVQDLFGDDPKRFTGFPNVTTAPGIKPEAKQHSFNKSSSLLPVAPDLQSSRLEHLSNSVMNSSALNDLENNSQSDADDDQDDGEVPATFVSQLDLNRFQRFLISELDDHEKEKETAIEKKNGKSEFSDEEGTALTEDSDSDGIDVVAINDTAKVKKVKSVIPESEKVKVIQKEQETELKQVLDGVQQMLPESVRASSTLHSQIAEVTDRSDSTLGQAILKLIQCMKETERRLLAESTLREQLSQDVQHLRTWVDALTADLITCQEHSAQLQQQLNQYRQVSQLQLCQLQEKCSISREEVQTLVNQHVATSQQKPPVPPSGSAKPQTQPTSRFVLDANQEAERLPSTSSDRTGSAVNRDAQPSSRLPTQAHLPSGLPTEAQRLSGLPGEVHIPTGLPVEAHLPPGLSVGAQFHPAAVLLSPPRQTHTPSSASGQQRATVNNNDGLKQNLLGQFDELDEDCGLKIPASLRLPKAPPTVQIRVPGPIPLNSGQQHNKPPQHTQVTARSQVYAAGDHNLHDPGQRSNSHSRQSNVVKEDLDHEQRDLEKELAELTRQHADAQTKLQSLLLQNSAQQQMTAVNGKRVSPPLSPISQASTFSAMLLPPP